jgi:hypothetical protein
MIFIVRDEHNESRDKVRYHLLPLYLAPVLHHFSDDREACNEHSYEPAQSKRR